MGKCKVKRHFVVVVLKKFKQLVKLSPSPQATWYMGTVSVGMLQAPLFPNSILCKEEF